MICRYLLWFLRKNICNIPLHHSQQILLAGFPLFDFLLYRPPSRRQIRLFYRIRQQSIKLPGKRGRNNLLALIWYNISPFLQCVNNSRPSSGSTYTPVFPLFVLIFFQQNPLDFRILRPSEHIYIADLLKHLERYLLFFQCKTAMFLRFFVDGAASNTGRRTS